MANVIFGKVLQEEVDFMFKVMNTFNNAEVEEAILFSPVEKKKPSLSWKETNIRKASCPSEVVIKEREEAGYDPTYPNLYAIQFWPCLNMGYSPVGNGVPLIGYRYVKKMAANGCLSPRLIEDRVQAVLEKAIAIHGTLVSPECALYSLGVDDDISKAATIAVATHFKFRGGRLSARFITGGFTSYDEAMYFHVRFLGTRTQFLDNAKVKVIEPIREICGIKIEKALILESFGDGEEWRLGFIATHPYYGEYRSFDGIHEDLKLFMEYAIIGFRRRRAWLRD
jgi:hypothetical protein